MVRTIRRTELPGSQGWGGMNDERARFMGEGGDGRCHASQRRERR